MNGPHLIDNFLLLCMAVEQTERRKEAGSMHHVHKLRCTYRQIEISDACILRSLARLHASVFAYFTGFVFEHEAPGDMLSHHFTICLISAQDTRQEPLVVDFARVNTSCVL